VVGAEAYGVVGRGAAEMGRDRYTGFRAQQAVRDAPGLEQTSEGMDALGGDDLFIMEADGKCLLYVPAGLKDNPFLMHYEPLESPVANPLYKQHSNPAVKLCPRPGNKYHAEADPEYPYIFSTYRVTELHWGGIATRVMAHNAEVQPEALSRSHPNSGRNLASATWIGLC
jgi:formate dehydrogenase major subunit